MSEMPNVRITHIPMQRDEKTGLRYFVCDSQPIVCDEAWVEKWIEGRVGRSRLCVRRGESVVVFREENVYLDE